MAHLLMGQIIAALQRFLATPHRIDKAALLIEIARQDLPYKLVGVTSLLSGSFRQFRFLLGREMYFHEAQSMGKRRVWQGWP